MAAIVPIPVALRIRNFDLAGGLGTLPNSGENVGESADYNVLQAAINNPNHPLRYWCDFGEDGVANSSDFNIWSQHTGHNCDTPTP
jgi:hypothetical protein